MKTKTLMVILIMVMINFTACNLKNSDNQSNNDSKGQLVKEDSLLTKHHSISFKVDSVSLAKELIKTTGLKHAIALKLFSAGSMKSNWTNTKYDVNFFVTNTTAKDKLIKGYCYADSNKQVIPTGGNGFLEACNFAYDQHRPLIISPDMIWLMICQGFSIHVNLNAEKLRDSIVSHKGKHNIIIERDGWRSNKKDNPWDEVFPIFTDSLRKHVKHDLCDLIDTKFTTTGKNESIAYETTLMESLFPYFTYEVFSDCGFPEITLEGKPSDWQWIRDNVTRFNKYGLENWTKNLMPILDKFVETSKGNVDKKFWQNMYKEKKAYSHDKINGWIIKFFPYVLTTSEDITFAEDGGTYTRLKYKSNPYMDGDKYIKSNLTLEDIPAGISKVDFLWKIIPEHKTFKMNFYAGFMGIEQDSKTKSLKPLISWAVCDKK